jgi:putative acetyltransferase
VQVRPEAPSDEHAIWGVITAAFLQAEHRGGNEAEIVAAMRSAGSLAVSLVATVDDSVVGHIAFSTVLIDGMDDGWFGLAPVAVLPEYHRMGIGSALIEAGLAQLRSEGAWGCVVLGDPSYYGRFGFVADAALRLEGVPPEYFQAVRFREPPCRGKVDFHPAFGVG